jgi:energy-coupling factor transporter ATP-binding protein EcfA2
MYILKAKIKNVRSITQFELSFDANPAGWHVIIGDNGAGKSTIVRSIALGLIGPTDAQALRLPLVNWIQKGADNADVTLTIQRDKTDGYSGPVPPLSRPKELVASIKITKDTSSNIEFGKIEKKGKSGIDPFHYIWSGKPGWFTTSFGPFRRFTGGDKEWSKVYYSNPRAAAHLSVFGEDVALTESLEWMTFMKFQSLEADTTAIDTLGALKKFINDGELLPHGAILTDVSSAGVFFKDGNGVTIDVTQLSDGFRSLLSLIFELIRQLVKTYGNDAVFQNINNGDMSIGVPGVVLIDEIDAHLHPTWQTRIGQWFTKYFPNIQFIVTTHSPLVCRACETGSIWRLAAPGSNNTSGKITGIERDRLIFGNVLDAYGTELFGENVSISDGSSKKMTRLSELNMKSVMGEITEPEEQEMQSLKRIFPTGTSK